MNEKLKLNDTEKVKQELKQMYPQFHGFIEHTLVAKMCLEYHNKHENKKR